MDADKGPVGRRDPLERAHSLFAQFLDRHSLADRGAFESFIAKNSADADALRAIARDAHAIGNHAHTDPAAANSNETVEIPTAADSQDLLDRLKGEPRTGTRFESREKIGSGGFGLVIKLWDSNLRRHIAKKILQTERIVQKGMSEERITARFLDEAQITAQLDHPGVVPVHDVGIDSDGELFFTMRYVRGETLGSIFDKVRIGVDGWNRTRAVSVILRACETMAFAHGKNVVHRDLKPANIMVGRYGETYVMDWGLARTLDAPDTRDLRIQPKDQKTHTSIRTDQRDGDESPIITMDGERLGTPSYMSPEQARGEVASIGKGSDVYSMGAILYELLSGVSPYLHSGVRASPYTILRWVLEGPPKSISSLAPDASLELAAICEKAMSREIKNRYASMEEMASDVRAYLENRVVRAYRHGPLVELAKWSRRNRLAASLAIASVLTLSISGFVVAWLRDQSYRAEHALRRQNDQLRAVRDSDAIVQDGLRLRPTIPSGRHEAEAWLTRAASFVKQIEDPNNEINTLRRLGKPRAKDALAAVRHNRISDSIRDLESAIESSTSRPTNETTGLDFQNRAVVARVAPLSLARLRKELEDADRAGALLQHWEFEDAATQQRHDSLVQLAAKLDALIDPDRGLIARVRTDLDSLRRRSTDTVATTNANQKWNLAAETIRNVAISPLYRGLDVHPVEGLIPLRQDPGSTLYEFLVEASGEAPRVRPDHSYEILPATGIVLVLIPGGRIDLGQQNLDPSDPTYWPFDAGSEFFNVHSVSLEPFFISKYELTQSQLGRLVGKNDSHFQPGLTYNGQPTVTEVNPADSLTTNTTKSWLRRWNLELPTDAQWLYAALGGYLAGRQFEASSTPADQYGNFGFGLSAGVDLCALDRRGADSFTATAAVDSFSPNSFGLFGIWGNVSELCDDYYVLVQTKESLVASSTRGQRSVGSSPLRTVRGGSYAVPLEPSQRLGILQLRMLFGGVADASEGEPSSSDDVGVRVVMNLGTTAQD